MGDGDKKFDDMNSGYLWHENDAVIERKGSFVVRKDAEGKDVKEYGALVKSFNNKGEVKYEFMVSVGLMHLNTDKKSERSPDMGGKIYLHKKNYKLGCWARESEKGTPFTSLGFDEIQDDGQESSNNFSTNNDENFKPQF